MFTRVKLSIVLILLFSTFIHANGLVPIAKKSIKYKEKIFSYDVVFVPESKKYSCKKYIDINLLKQNRYYAKSFLRKGKPICLRNVTVPTENSVKFKFGNLEIEQEGIILNETDKYIKIKNLDGTINKIYKDGRK